MIDLSQSFTASSLIQTVQKDPGAAWKKDTKIALDAPPDSEVDPSPEAQWPGEAVRTGIYGTVTPRVVTLPDGSYRMYYTQILPRPGFPAGANDYGNATTRILSATSPDGSVWTPEPGIRLSAQDGGAGEFRVVCGDVVPRADAEGQYRMYYECCTGSQKIQNSVRSAVSEDGLNWTAEPGERFSGGSYSSPRIVFLENGQCRLYFYERGRGIISALSNDGGMTFRQDPGLRIARNEMHDAFAPEIIALADGGYIMYFAAYHSANYALILRALSDNGMVWQIAKEPAIVPSPGTWDGVKCSEMCVFRLPHAEGRNQRYRILYEACDGTAKDKRGIWRIVGATSVR